MRKVFLLILCLALPLCAASCGKTAEEEPFSAAFTIRQPTQPTEVFFDTSYTGETQVVRDDTLDYNALRALYIEGLFSAQTQSAVRWNTALLYALEGDFSTQDAKVMSDLAIELVRVNGFPGMRETTSENANVHIRFAKADKPDFRYTADEHGRMRSATILIPAAYLPAQRSAAVRQYMMRACGFLQTVQTEMDSVLAENPASDLSDADFILLNVLYGIVEPGADKTACLTAFEQYFEE